MKRAVLSLILVLATASAYPRAQQPAALRFTYFGAAGWEITDGKTTVLIDPYLTRAKYAAPNDGVSDEDTRPTVTNRSIVESDTATIDAHITRADVILMTHTHPDHSLDLPYIATRTGAIVVGTESTANLVRAYGVPETQTRIVSGHEKLKFGDASVQVIPCIHGIFQAAEPGAPPPRVATIPAGLTPPIPYGQHAEGGTLAYLVGIGGRQILIFGSMNYIEKELVGLRPDIAMIGSMPQRRFIDDYTGRLMRVLGLPPIVIPTHWDRWNVPYGFSQQPAIERVQPFIAEVKAASPKTRVIMGEHLKPFTIEAPVRR